MKKFVLLFLVFFLVACEPDIDTGKKDDGFDQPTNVDDTEHIPTILVNEQFATVMEDGVTAEDWTLYFKIEDVLDGTVPVTEEMLTWSPEYDYSVPGEYVLTCEYTNSEGTSNSASVSILVKETDQFESHDEVDVVIIGINEWEPIHFEAGFNEPDWRNYFSLKVNGIETPVTNDMLLWDTEMDMYSEGLYTLSIEYVDSLGISHSHSVTISIGESFIDTLTPMTIYDILYQGLNYSDVRIDGLEVVTIFDNYALMQLNGEYIVVSTYSSNMPLPADYLQVGDVVNVAGEFQYSSSWSLRMELVARQIVKVSSGEPSERNPVDTDLATLFDIIDVQYYTTLRKTVATYNEISKQLGDMIIMNELALEDGVTYEVELIMYSNYENEAPVVVVVSFEEYEEIIETPTINPYVPFRGYGDGSEVQIVVDYVSSISEHAFVANAFEYPNAYAGSIIVDTTGTNLEWIADSLVEGGSLKVDGVIVKVEDDTNGYGFKFVPTANPIITALSPNYIMKDPTIGDAVVTTKEELLADLEYDIQVLGIMPDDNYTQYFYEMTATYDSTNNTFGGFNVSVLGVQLIEDGEYKVQFVIDKLYYDAPYAEIIILAPFYELPQSYTVDQELATLRNLTIISNNGTIIVAVNETNDVTITINIEDNSEWSALEPETLIHVVGVTTILGYTDTDISVTAVDIQLAG